MSAKNFYADKTIVKFFDGVLVSISFFLLILFIIQFLPVSVYSNKGVLLLYMFCNFTFFDILFLLIGFLYIAYAAAKRKRGGFDEEKAHAFCIVAIRYSLALGIAMYGFSKFLGAQMPLPSLALGDARLSDLKESDLTFYYFGMSRPFVMIIATIEVVGPILLMFRRTLLAGILLLLPAMINIFLLNLFYKIGSGALFNSAYFSAGLIFLLLLHWEKIKSIFSQSDYMISFRGASVTKYLVRFAVLFMAFMLTYQWQLRTPENFVKGNREVLGKWEVDNHVINGRKADEVAKNDEKRWYTFYFENGDRFAYSNNPYYFNATKGKVSGNYWLDEKNKKISMVFFQSGDSLVADIIKLENDKLALKRDNENGYCPVKHDEDS